MGIGRKKAAPERVEKGIGRGKMAAPMYKKERGQKRKDDSVPVKV